MYDLEGDGKLEIVERNYTTDDHPARDCAGIYDDVVPYCD